MTTTRRGSFQFGALALCAAMAVVPPGCKSPMERSAEQKLRDELLNSNRRYREVIADGGLNEVWRDKSDTVAKIPEERIKELDDVSSPEVLSKLPLDTGGDLEDNKNSNTVNLTLARAIQL